jgi:hypothetical protein
VVQVGDSGDGEVARIGEGFEGDGDVAGLGDRDGDDRVDPGAGEAWRSSTLDPTPGTAMAMASTDSPLRFNTRCRAPATAVSTASLTVRLGGGPPAKARR